MGQLQYNHQLIINLLTGTDDKVITGGSLGLHKRFQQNNPTLKSQIITLKLSDKSALVTGSGSPTDENDKPADLNAAIAALTDESRLYIRGHGDWQNQTVGGWFGGELAKLLAGRGLPADILINVTGCNAARDSDSTLQAKLTPSMDSFAATLHRKLKDKHKLKVWVIARVYYVTVMNYNDPLSNELMVFKLTRDESDWTPEQKRKDSKVLFLWENDVQVRRWWDYDADDPAKMRKV